MIQTKLDIKYELVENSSYDVLINFLTEIESILKDPNTINKQSLIDTYFEFVIRIFKVMIKQGLKSLTEKSFEKTDLFVVLFLLQLTFFHMVVIEHKIYFTINELVQYLKSKYRSIIDLVKELENIFKKNNCKYKARESTMLWVTSYICVLFSFLCRNNENTSIDVIKKEFLKKLNKFMDKKYSTKEYVVKLISYDERFMFLIKYIIY